MALEPVVGVARCVFRGISGTLPIVNVMHVRNQLVGVSVPHTQATINQLATSLASLWVGNLQPQVSTSYLGVDVTCTDLTTDLGVVGVAPTLGTGSGAGSTTPQSAAAVISWKISRHYRGGHPRTYMGPLASAVIFSTTSLQGTYVTALNAAATAFRNAVNALVLAGNTQTLVCVHRVRTTSTPPGPENLVPPLVDEITSNSVDSRIDSQRRRLGKDR